MSYSITKQSRFEKEILEDDIRTEKEAKILKRKFERENGSEYTIRIFQNLRVR